MIVKVAKEITQYLCISCLFLFVPIATSLMRDLLFINLVFFKDPFPAIFFLSIFPLSYSQIFCVGINILGYFPPNIDLIATK